MPREHSIALSNGYGEYECECGPCSINKINAKRQVPQRGKLLFGDVELDDDLGGGLGIFIMLFAGIFLFGLGYVVLMFISMFDIMTFGLFNWDWLWWDNNAWKEF